MIKRYLAKRNNPWELLAIAALIFVPGIVMLLQKKPMIAFPLGSGSWRDPGPMYEVELSRHRLRTFWVGLRFSFPC
jgi:hypothetical protein